MKVSYFFVPGRVVLDSVLPGRVEARTPHDDDGEEQIRIVLVRGEGGLMRMMVKKKSASSS